MPCIFIWSTTEKGFSLSKIKTEKVLAKYTEKENSGEI